VRRAQRHDGTRLPRRITGPRFAALMDAGNRGAGGRRKSATKIFRFREGTVVFDFVKQSTRRLVYRANRSEAGASRYVQSGRDQRIRPPHAGEAENQRVGLIRFRGGRARSAENQRAHGRIDSKANLLESFGIHRTLAQIQNAGRRDPLAGYLTALPFRSCRTPNRIPRCRLASFPGSLYPRFLYGAPRSRCPDYWLRTWNRPGHRSPFAKEGAARVSFGAHGE